MKSKRHIFRNTSHILALLVSLLLSTQTFASTPENIEGAKKITAEELISLAETKPDLIIIDARINKDRTHGYIEGSISLPNTETNCLSLSKAITKKNHPTVYYCNGPKCGRSVKSIKIALQCGYKNIYWYRGGFEDWQDKNYPYLIQDH